MRAAVLINLIFLFAHLSYGQEVSISEEKITLDTYDFGEPNPVPILSENPKIFPYFKFEGYEHTSKKKEWKVVTLENEYIKVMILPEIGGKVWGAIEKSTGEEFLYKNEVVKFRNIAMRGPWTSGGIEFNFGIIGHHPSTGTAVDYVTRTNVDGSVSCIVGSSDLPSNTQWRVEIRLEKDKAYFETNASWYNASPLNQSYYNWMTGAAKASNDLEFFIPGNKFLGHGGEANLWPIDEEDRNLSNYKNNAFGSHKSYHIVGAYKDFFGGYYHDTNFGFGHWSPYEEMPGQKLWLWALSRSGGIWEDLLTDTDGQYIEFQAGRLFNQYSPSQLANPIKQVDFEPYVMDSWSEIWFPYKEIGGMEDASKLGVLNVERSDGKVFVGFNALQNVKEKLLIKVEGQEVFSEDVSLQPMEVYTKELSIATARLLEVSVGGKKLYYTSESTNKLIKRPFVDDENLSVTETEKLYEDASEAIKFRDYTLAYSTLSKLLELDPSHVNANLKLAELEYRRGAYAAALKLVHTVLKKNTYNVDANYLAGVIYRSQKDYVNALESLGWAARSISYRAVAYTQMGEIYLLLHDYEKAMTYANKALGFNVYNLNAKQLQLILARKQKNETIFKEVKNDLLEVDGLSLVAFAEEHLKNGSPISRLKIQNEFPEESLLALAIYYHSLGLYAEAKTVLQAAPHSVKAKIWLAYLERNNAQRAAAILKSVEGENSDFVFPYRRETIAVLEWAVKENAHWKFTYYLAQNYIATGSIDKGKQLLIDSKNQPDADVFYRFRAALIKDQNFESKESDYVKALDLKAEDWKVWDEVIRFYVDQAQYKKAYEYGVRAKRKFSDNYKIDLSLGNALLHTGRYEAAISLLKKSNVLPYELASESKRIYTQAHSYLALEFAEKKQCKKAIALLQASKEYPENLGVGKPYNTDTRMQDYLLAQCYEKVGNSEKSKEALLAITAYAFDINAPRGVNHLYGLLAYKKLGKDTSDYLKSLEKMESNEGAIIAFAFFTNNNAKKKQLLESKKISNTEFEFMESVVNF